METDEYRKLFELENELWWFRGMREISMVLAERYSPPRPPNEIRVLDAGCGTGGMMATLCRLGVVFGLDFSAEALHFAKARADTPLVRGDVSKLPFASASFDVVTSFDVLYHRNVHTDEDALSEIARVLRPDGILLLRVPAFDALRSLHDAAVHTRQRYGKSELEGKLRRAGFATLFVSFLNCLLFPAALVRRLAERVRHPKPRGSEVRPVPGWLNETLLGILRLEARLVRFTSLPFGLSLVAVAQRARGG